VQPVSHDVILQSDAFQFFEDNFYIITQQIIIEMMIFDITLLAEAVNAVVHGL
jgi:hypothetical protein